MGRSPFMNFIQTGSAEDHELGHQLVDSKYGPVRIDRPARQLFQKPRFSPLFKKLEFCMGFRIRCKCFEAGLQILGR